MTFPFSLSLLYGAIAAFELKKEFEIFGGFGESVMDCLRDEVEIYHFYK